MENLMIDIFVIRIFRAKDRGADPSRGSGEPWSSIQHTEIQMNQLRCPILPMHERRRSR